MLLTFLKWVPIGPRQGKVEPQLDNCRNPEGRPVGDDARLLAGDLPRRHAGVAAFGYAINACPLKVEVYRPRERALAGLQSHHPGSGTRLQPNLSAAATPWTRTQVRSGLAAGGRWIRNFGPGTKGPVFLAEGELRDRARAAKKGC
jgi:hypothetical protein